MDLWPSVRPFCGQLVSSCFEPAPQHTCPAACSWVSCISLEPSEHLTVTTVLHCPVQTPSFWSVSSVKDRECASCLEMLWTLSRGKEPWMRVMGFDHLLRSASLEAEMVWDGVLLEESDRSSDFACSILCYAVYYLFGYFIRNTYEKLFEKCPHYVFYTFCLL